MSDSSDLPSPPVSAAIGFVGVPQALIPASVKAIDRLLGAMVDVPVAWLAQQKARIDARTEALVAVESAIAKSATSAVGADQRLAEGALTVLTQKAYRQQINRSAVAAAALEDLRSSPAEEVIADSGSASELDEDWLNVFERHAEDASTERMQGLWGRVLAGEIRKPGKFSMRTIRFLSEFSQEDARTFSEFCDSVFDGLAPNALVKPEGTNIRTLVNLESAGLITGAGGPGLLLYKTFDEKGYIHYKEPFVTLTLQSVPGTRFDFVGCILTPLGKELVELIPNRDAVAAARRVAYAIKQPSLSYGFLTRNSNSPRKATDVLWHPEYPSPAEALPIAPDSEINPD